MLEYKDFPALFRTCDSYSMAAQRKYIFWFRFELLLLVTGGVVGTLDIENEQYGKYIAILAAALFLGGLVVSFYRKFEKLEDSWYIGRALAESIKSVTWRYAVKGEPFEETIENVDSIFRKMMREFIDENKEFIKGNIPEDNMHAVSPKMKEIRNSSFEDRKTTYLSERVNDQLSWYRRKSNYNKKKKDVFFGFTVIAYSLAIVTHLILISDNTFLNVTSIFATVVGCLISWTTMKKYQELSQSYAVTAHEISLILESGAEINNQEDFYAFVGDAEAAFSREHTLWLARRDVVR
ncbi:DUF4231 domain-containing protein [Neolewinella lacunae]|uniref:DUF4231 domain-containing protein n=1 Tax=Neolewinella lacunae TaxID=1517758 RepID=A0A923PKT2_9BACT|nr:DUF4231 domain-containing protein [Neolewinella lacunae]MBC6995880.1 DUF4231 domain-containing protein [Neolewinella lacunae]MDN3636428.1 DUF4231 domain-containing protein [Neolewinella lacunae]